MTFTPLCDFSSFILSNSFIPSPTSPILMAHSSYPFSSSSINLKEKMEHIYLKQSMIILECISSWSSTHLYSISQSITFSMIWQQWWFQMKRINMKKIIWQEGYELLRSPCCISTIILLYLLNVYTLFIYSFYILCHHDRSIWLLNIYIL